MKAKKGRKWTPEQKEEARLRALLDAHREPLKEVLRDPVKVKVLTELAKL